MADLWYPGGISDPAPAQRWGAHADTGEPKFLLHTTEGGLGAYHPDPAKGPGRRYYGNTGTWPNYTLARRGRGGPWRVFNHIPANRASMSLRNLPGGVQTNRDNVSQVEIATKAADIASLPAEVMGELAKLLAWEHTTRGVPLTSGVRWVAYPAPYGNNDSQRLSPQAWDAYSGVLGHQHAPENDHGDPGAFPIGALLTRAGGQPGGPADKPAGAPVPDPGRAGNRFRGFPLVGLGDADDPARVAAGRADPRLVDPALPVLTLQTWLNRAMGATLYGDGDYGPLTQAAVAHFQRWWRDRGVALAVDGVCGEQTWSQLDTAADVQGR